MAKAEPEAPADPPFQLEALEYTPDPGFFRPYLDEVLNDSYSTVLLNPAYAKPGPDGAPERPRPARARLVRTNTRASRRAQTFRLLEQNRALVAGLVAQLFWVVHVQLHRPGEGALAERLLCAVGRAWGNFLFPFETDTAVDGRVRDLFVECVPYFVTQCAQHLFVLISRGLPETTTRAFRLRVCARLVRIFTMVEPLESLLQAKLASFFARPPQVDIVSAQPPAKPLETRTLLPAEDLATLITIPRRKRPRSTVWTISAISTLVSASTHRKAVPFEHNSTIVVQYPKDGEADWTTELPPLLPMDLPQSRTLTFESYDPAKDSRSLLYRSRRPMLCDDYFKMKRDFEMQNELAREKLKKGEVAFGQMKEDARASPLLVLKRFCEDIRVLQLERKWNESPEWHTEQELIDSEEAKIQRERQLEREAQEERELKKARKAPKLLPFEVEELAAKRRAELEAMPMDGVPGEESPATAGSMETPITPQRWTPASST
jgi:hypothetical protein